MSTKALNKRKAEILNQQELMLKRAVESKIQLSETEHEQFKNFTKELDDINENITRFEAIAKGKLEVGTPSSSAVITDNSATRKFRAMGDYRNPTFLNSDYAQGFWKALSQGPNARTAMDQFYNASLGELGSTAAGGALVPIETDPSIPNLAIVECSARGLSRVITTEMDINVPYQAAKTVAAVKAESNSGGQNSFAENDPTFATTKLSAYMIGGKVTASWELLQDAKAASQFISADLARAITVEEEYLFINGSGSSQPQGYLGNAATPTGTHITAGAGTLGINPILETMGSLNRAYYKNASWLWNRQEAVRLLEAQLAASQYQTYFTFNPDGSWRLLGFQMEFSTEIPTYSASPVTTGAVFFGDFNSFAVIGDRGDSNIKVKVLDQVNAVQGQTVILGYRRVDQRIVLQEAVQQLTING